MGIHADLGSKDAPKLQTATTLDMKEAAVTDDLNELLKVAKRFSPTPEQREEQRRSFAYGNTSFENPMITREMIDEQAERIAAENNEQRRK